MATDNPLSPRHSLIAILKPQSSPRIPATTRQVFLLNPDQAHDARKHNGRPKLSAEERALREQERQRLYREAKGKLLGI